MPRYQRQRGSSARLERPNVGRSGVAVNWRAPNYVAVPIATVTHAHRRLARVRRLVDMVAYAHGGVDVVLVKYRGRKPSALSAWPMLTHAEARAVAAAQPADEDEQRSRARRQRLLERSGVLP